MIVDLDAALRNEPYLQAMFDALRARPSPVLVEAGANDGYHTRVFHAAVPGLRSFAFEPDPRNVKLLERTGLPVGSTFVAAALGDHTGTVPFHLATPEPNGAIGASSLSALMPSLTAAHPWLKPAGDVEVQSWRLDDFTRAFRIDSIDLLWMDVQGAERLLFRGLRGCWRWVRSIYTEHDAGYADSSTLEELVGQLNAMAGTPPPWRIAMRVPGNALLVNEGCP